MHQISFWFFSKGHNSRKGDNSDKKKNMGQLFFPWGIHIWNFKTLACTAHKMRHASDFILIFSMRHNSRKEDNSVKKKKTQVSYFSMRNPYMKFQNSSMACMFRTGACTDARTDIQKPIGHCPVNFFKVGGITKWHVCPVKTQISPNICPVWSESSRALNG